MHAVNFTYGKASRRDTLVSAILGRHAEREVGKLQPEWRVLVPFQALWGYGVRKPK